MDPIAELAEQKGRADAELAVSRTVYSAAEVTPCAQAEDGAKTIPITK
jgi:hypothetical protein